MASKPEPGAARRKSPPAKPRTKPQATPRAKPAAAPAGDAAYDTRYTLYLLLARAGARPLYHWDQWRRAVPWLDPIVAAARGDKPAIWVTGTFSGGGYGDFGKIGWGARGHQRWPVAAPLLAPEARTGKFSTFRLWKPSRPTSRKQGVGPDLHMELWDAANHQIPGCDYGFLLAASELLPPAARQAAPAAVRQIAGMIDLTLAATTQAPWGARAPGQKKVSTGDTITFALGSLVHGLARFAGGAAPPTVADLGGGWVPFA